MWQEARIMLRTHKCQGPPYKMYSPVRSSAHEFCTPMKNNILTKFNNNNLC
jgi:hypothetical protein